MCDTFVALPNATATGAVIFGKNSDRPQGEIQDVVTIPAQTYAPDQQLQCTYLQIPQVERTYAVILSKPQWMWGAEMGANEQGVVIGNEAVWTTQPYAETGLLGMDLVRLGLERGESALSALEIIIKLLTKYGQGGNCSDQFALTYHNSFLIADPNEAYVLETADRYWVVERVTQGTRSISNSLSIRDAGSFRHPKLIDWAIEQGFCTNFFDFDFAKIFSEGEGSDRPSPDFRGERVRSLCQRHSGEFTTETAKQILRDHQGNVCMHDSYESRGSQISSLLPNQHQHWFIEQPFPCQQEYRQKTFVEEVMGNR
ncbi:MAG: hypothetical protein Kow00121_44650 [Elainellaceae cyanobacterium]